MPSFWFHMRELTSPRYRGVNLRHRYAQKDDLYGSIPWLEDQRQEPEAAELDHNSDLRNLDVLTILAADSDGCTDRLALGRSRHGRYAAYSRRPGTRCHVGKCLISVAGFIQPGPISGLGRPISNCFFGPATGKGYTDSCPIDPESQGRADKFGLRRPTGDSEYSAASP